MGQVILKTALHFWTAVVRPRFDEAAAVVVSGVILLA
jgi:hypothetical protein